MTLKKCTVAVTQGGRRVEVGTVLDHTNDIVVAFPSSFGNIPASTTTYTQTYSTAASTVPDATVAAVATTAAGLAIFGFAEAQANTIPVAINALAADVLAIKKVVTQIIDDLQAAGLAS